MKRYHFVLIISVLIVEILAWSPRIIESCAKTRAAAEFERAWTNVANGCGFACHGCWAAACEKIPFGVQVTLKFSCGMQLADAPETDEQVNVFVSSIGKAHRIPEP